MTTAVLVGLIVVVALLAVLVAGLLRSHAEILRALHDLGQNLDPNEHDAEHPMAAAVPGRRPRPVDAVGVDVTGRSPTGTAVHIAVAGSPTPTLLAFLSSTCLTCRTFWTEFGAPRIDTPGGARLVIVTQGEESESPSAIAELAPGGVTTVLSSDAWQAYSVPGAPYFVLLDTDGEVLGEGAATSWARVHDLLTRAQADDAHLSGRERELLIDEMLHDAGIGRDHPTLGPGSPTT